MKKIIVSLSMLVLQSALFAETLGNPYPQTLQTPNGTGGIEAMVKRLEEGSGGKTPTVKEFPSKNFPSWWLRSISERGEPKIYTRENSRNFDYIGMPIGGIGCGQLYLGGDGRLWNWDFFNDRFVKHFVFEQGAAYATPPIFNNSKDRGQNIFDQGFALRLKTPEGERVISLDRDGFKDVRFLGQYPIGQVAYVDPSLPVKVELEAMSPFIPLNLADSSYPATVLAFTVTNTSALPVEGTLAGWLENMICVRTASKHDAQFKNKVISSDHLTLLECSASEPNDPPRTPIIFENWEKETYEGWTVEGTAFGAGPIVRSSVPTYQGDLGGEGQRVVNSHSCASANISLARDNETGKLTSKPFVIERKSIVLWVGGGDQAGKTCINLLIDGKVVRSVTGRKENKMVLQSLNVVEFQGQKGVLEIVDSVGQAWGHIGVGKITFRDQLAEKALELEVDYGTMALGVLNDGKSKGVGLASVDRGTLPSAAFDSGKLEQTENNRLVGAVGKIFSLKPGERTTLRFILTWYFPNPIDHELKTPKRRAYAVRFKSAMDIAEQLAVRIDPLTKETRLWRDTWYNSTLPYWFLDRTFLNTSILATSTSLLLEDGRFYGYEGVYSCPGTCTHVWNYNHATASLFPEIEISLREKVDFNPNVGFLPNGGIGMRGEYQLVPAIDGQCGAIIRCLRIHQMSPDNTFLKRNWKSIRMAMDYLINKHDTDHDGIMEGGQHNTLDCEWFGKIAWLSIYYQAALQATATMADNIGEVDYAEKLRKIAVSGRAYVESKLFNNEYFFHEVDPKHPQSPGSFGGCHIDQLLGQGQAYQVGLGQIIDPVKVTTALNSIWKYNFTTDVGIYREKFKAGRWYAMPGEAGIIMGTWPYGGDEALKRGNPLFSNYLNECFNGSEYSLTGLMIWQGLVDKAMVHTRAVHDRHDGSKRNPWNECECGSHYSRSMASYGLFTAISGFECDGPRGYIGFAPRLTPENFKCAFTSAEGWGNFEQKTTTSGLQAQITVMSGKLKLKEVSLVPTKNTVPHSAKITLTHGKDQLPNILVIQGGKAMIKLTNEIVVSSGDVVQIQLNQ